MIFGYNIFYSSITYFAEGFTIENSNERRFKLEGFGRFCKVPSYQFWLKSIYDSGVHIQNTYTDRTFV